MHPVPLGVCLYVCVVSTYECIYRNQLLCEVTERKVSIANTIPCVCLYQNNTRTDVLDSFDFHRCTVHGNGQFIPAGFIISELAFKIGVRSKYGA